MVVLLERARELHDHGGEVGFPGGGWEPGDASPVATALREVQEEIGVDPAGIDPAETHRVLTVNLRQLAQPNRWSTLTVPGWSGPNFLLDDATVVWGYTAELLAFMRSAI